MFRCPGETNDARFHGISLTRQGSPDSPVPECLIRVDSNSESSLKVCQGHHQGTPERCQDPLVRTRQLWLFGNRPLLHKMWLPHFTDDFAVIFRFYVALISHADLLIKQQTLKQRSCHFDKKILSLAAARVVKMTTFAKVNHGNVKISGRRGIFMLRYFLDICVVCVNFRYWCYIVGNWFLSQTVDHWTDCMV